MTLNTPSIGTPAVPLSLLDALESIRDEEKEVEVERVGGGRWRSKRGRVLDYPSTTVTDSLAESEREWEGRERLQGKKIRKGKEKKHLASSGF
jgi:hypothetical protein